MPSSNTTKNEEDKVPPTDTTKIEEGNEIEFFEINLSNLPNELKMTIASYLSESQKSKLVQVSKDFKNLLQEKIELDYAAAATNKPFSYYHPHYYFTIGRNKFFETSKDLGLPHFVINFNANNPKISETGPISLTLAQIKVVLTAHFAGELIEGHERKLRCYFGRVAKDVLFGFFKKVHEEQIKSATKVENNEDQMPPKKLRRIT